MTSKDNLHLRDTYDVYSRGIYLKPVNGIVQKLNDSSNNEIYLIGKEGSGKTTVINELISNQNNPQNPIINCSPKYEDLCFFSSPKAFKLYQVCLIVKRLILFIGKNETPDVYIKFENLLFLIEKIINRVNLMNMLLATDDEYDKYFGNLCRIESEDLINMFVELAIFNLDYENITIVLDSFDKIACKSAVYQKHIYQLLKEHFKIILAVSDTKILENPTILNNDSEIINVQYTEDVDVVKNILDYLVVRELFSKEKIDLSKRIRFILSDDIIAQMIQKTNGNLFDMLSATRYLYNHLDSTSDYADIILGYIDTVINKNPIYTGYYKQERKLFIC